jgi:hypothetical protein
MSFPRSTSRGRTVAVSVLAAGTIGLSGSAAMVATASAAGPAAPRQQAPATPETPTAALLAVVNGLLEAINPLLVGLASFDLDAAIASLTEGQLGQLLTGLTGVQLAAVLDGTAPNRILAAVTSLLSSQLVPLIETIADALRDNVPAPVGVQLKDLLDIVAGVLTERGVAIPPQVASLLAQPAIVPSTPAAAPAPTSSRARIFDATSSRDRGSVRVDLSCPAVSGTSCAVTVRPTIAGRSAGKARRATINRGRSKVLRVPLSTSARKRLAARGGTVRIAVRTAGATRGPLSSTVRVPAPRGT